MPARSDRTLVVGLSREQAIDLVKQTLQALPATIQSLDELRGILLARKEASTESWGENIHVSVTPSGESASQIHIECESALSSSADDHGASAATIATFEGQLAHQLSQRSLPPPLNVNTASRPTPASAPPTPVVPSVPAQPVAQPIAPAGYYAPRPPKDRGTALVLEILPGLFGILGIGWLYSRNTNAGVLWLIGVLVWDVFAVIIAAATAGFGAFCTIPIQIVLITVSAVSLNNYTKRRPELFGA